MTRAHDRGGWPTEEPIDQSEHLMKDWERRFEAINSILSGKGIMRVDEVRRAVEDIEANKYETIGYYDRRVEALETLMVEKSILTREAIDLKVADMDRPWSK